VLALPNQARLTLPASFPPHPPRSRDAPLRLAYVGRFEAHQKGLDWLTSTLRADLAWARGCHWRFQGRGPAEAMLHELASALGAERAEVLAHAPIEHALAACDVLLLCSRFEGLPLVALEATAWGCPVVASRSSGLQDLLPASALFDFGDATGLRRAIEGLRTEAARQRAVAHAQARLAVLCDAARYRTALQRVVQALRGDNSVGTAPC
jgi:glycosyltransferase involved in cell wall biosynthesis